MSILRSLSGLLSSAIDTPPNILAATRSFSLTSADNRGLLSVAVKRTAADDAVPSSTDVAVPEVDMSHLSAEERQQIAAVMARAQVYRELADSDTRRPSIDAQPVTSSSEIDTANVHKRATQDIVVVTSPEDVDNPTEVAQEIDDRAEATRQTEPIDEYVTSSEPLLEFSPPDSTTVDRSSVSTQQETEKPEAVGERHLPVAAEDFNGRGQVACDVTPSRSKPLVTVDNVTNGTLSAITTDLNETYLGRNCAPSDNIDEMSYHHIESVSPPLSTRKRQERPHKPASYKLTTTGTLVECKTSVIDSTSAEHRRTDLGQDQIANSLHHFSIASRNSVPASQAASLSSRNTNLSSSPASSKTYFNNATQQASKVPHPRPSKTITGSVAVTSVPPTTAWLSPRNTGGLQRNHHQHHHASNRVVDPMFSAAYSRLDFMNSTSGSMVSTSSTQFSSPTSLACRQPRRPSPQAVSTTRAGLQPSPLSISRHHIRGYQHQQQQQQLQQVPTNIVYEYQSPHRRHGDQVAGYKASLATHGIESRRRALASRSMEILDRLDGDHSLAGGACLVTGSRLRSSGSALSLSDSSSWDDDEWYRWETTEEKLVRLQTEINDRRRRLHHLLRRASSFDHHHHQQQQQQQQRHLGDRSEYHQSPAAVRCLLIDTPASHSVCLRRPARYTSPRKQHLQLAAQRSQRQAALSSQLSQVRIANSGNRPSRLYRSISMVCTNDPESLNQPWNVGDGPAAAFEDPYSSYPFGSDDCGPVSTFSAATSDLDDAIARLTGRTDSGSQLDSTEVNSLDRRQDQSVHHTVLGVLGKRQTHLVPDDQKTGTGLRQAGAEQLRRDNTDDRSDLILSSRSSTSTCQRSQDGDAADQVNHVTREQLHNEFQNIMKQTGLQCESEFLLRQKLGDSASSGLPPVSVPGEHKSRRIDFECNIAGDNPINGCRTNVSSATTMTSSTAHDDPTSRPQTSFNSLQRSKTKLYSGKIEVAMSYFSDGCSSEMPGGDTLCVRVIQAAIEISATVNVSENSPMPTLNPVARVSLQIPTTATRDGSVQRQQSTACALGTMNPTWRQSLVFHGPPDRRHWPSTYVHVTVWDRDRFLPDRLIGEVTVKLGDGSRVDGQPRWYRLRMRCSTFIDKSPKNVKDDDNGDSDNDDGTDGQDGGGGGGGGGSSNGGETGQNESQSYADQRSESKSRVHKSARGPVDADQSQPSDDVSLT